MVVMISFWHSCFHSKNFRALRVTMSRLSCVQNCLCPDYRAFKIAYVQTIVRSKLHMSRLSCVQNCICPDYRAFIFFPDRVILNARRHLVRSFGSGHIDFQSGTSTWETYLFWLKKFQRTFYRF